MPNVRVWTYTGRNRQTQTCVMSRIAGWEPSAALLAEGRDARILDATHFHLEYPNPLLLPIVDQSQAAAGF